MKKLYIVLFIGLIHYSLFATIDDDEIKKACNLYITSITDYYKGVDTNNSYENLLYQVFDYNSDIYVHQNDLFDEGFSNENDIDSYLGYVDINYKSNLDVEFGETNILSCKITDNGKLYVFATIPKILRYKENVREFELLLGMYKHNDKYVVEYALFNSKQNLDKLLNQCSSSIVKVNEDRLKLEREHLQWANVAYSKANYFEAKRRYQKVLAINPKNTAAIDGLVNSEKLITKDIVVTEINQLVQFKKFNEALDKLKDFERTFPNTLSEWASKIRKVCNEGIQNKTYINNLKLADSKYRIALYNEAINYYNKAKSYSKADTKYIQKQIELCNIGSPKKVSELLKEAYVMAKYSKKYWLSTYKLYIQYQNSGLLTGDNYRFMCSMMETKYNQVAKKMGYSRRQANKLARKYLFRAEELGINMDFWKYQVLTPNRLKSKK